MGIKILGISASPISGGNTEMFLGEALKAAEEYDDIQTELITLADKEINDCKHCRWCAMKQQEGKFCAQNDDMTGIYPRLIQADGLLLATPVYMGRLSGYMAAFLDRFMAFAHGKVYRGALKNKVGGALSVSWSRNAGPELALLGVASIIPGMGMILVTPGVGLGAQWGAVALSSEGGMGKASPEDRLWVLKDEYGLMGARVLVGRMVELITIIKAGEAAMKTG